MRPTPLSGLIGMSATAGLAFVLVACGTRATSRTSTQARATAPAANPSTTRARAPAPASALTVTPALGTRTTVFELRFTAPVAATVSGGTRRGYQLGFTGPSHSGCVGSGSAPVPAVSRGHAASIGLDPAKLGGRWCAGTYSVRVLEVQTAACAPGEMCPQFVRVIGTVGRVSFRVVGTG